MLKEADEDISYKLPFVLVGSKCDLEDDRVVTKEEGTEMGETLGCKFLEASAKTNQK